MEQEILLQRLEQAYPAELAMDWDNSGLQAGSRRKEIKCVYVALDATEEVISHALEGKADLLITHHPLIFSGIKSVTDQSVTGKKILRLLEGNISCFSMHTNYDIVTMGSLAGKMLGIAGEDGKEANALEPVGNDPCQGIGKVGMLREPMSLENLALQVKEKFQLEGVCVYGDKKQIITKAAVCPGSGKGMTAFAKAQGAQVLITGDIGHHDGLDAVEMGVAIIDAGHFGLEHIFLSQMEDWLHKQFLQLQVIVEPLKNPLQYL